MKTPNTSPEYISPIETHGTLLRMATDQLEEAIGELAFSSEMAIVTAEVLLADIVSARIKQEFIQG